MTERIRLNEIALLLVTSLLPYGVELSDDILFYTFFGYSFHQEGNSFLEWVSYSILGSAFHPLRPLEESLQILYMWSAIVIIPLLLNVLLIVFSYRIHKSKSSILSLHYLTIGALAYSLGLSMMSGILSLPITPIVAVILLVNQWRTKHT